MKLLRVEEDLVQINNNMQELYYSCLLDLVSPSRNIVVDSNMDKQQFNVVECYKPMVLYLKVK